VLVVDDNHDIVLTMAELLRAEGHEAEACFGGKRPLNASRGTTGC